MYYYYLYYYYYYNYSYYCGGIHVDSHMTIYGHMTHIYIYILGNNTCYNGSDGCANNDCGR